MDLSVQPFSNPRRRPLPLRCILRHCPEQSGVCLGRKGCTTSHPIPPMSTPQMYPASRRSRSSPEEVSHPLPRCQQAQNMHSHAWPAGVCEVSGTPLCSPSAECLRHYIPPLFPPFHASSCALSTPPELPSIALTGALPARCVKCSPTTRPPAIAIMHLHTVLFPRSLPTPRPPSEGTHRHTPAQASGTKAPAAILAPHRGPRGCPPGNPGGAPPPAPAAIRAAPRPPQEHPPWTRPSAGGPPPSRCAPRRRPTRPAPSGLAPRSPAPRPGGTRAQPPMPPRPPPWPNAADGACDKRRRPQVQPPPTAPPDGPVPPRPCAGSWRGLRRHASKHAPLRTRPAADWEALCQRPAPRHVSGRQSRGRQDGPIASGSPAVPVYASYRHQPFANTALVTRAAEYRVPDHWASSAAVDLRLAH